MKIRRKIMTPANLNLDSLLSESDRSGLLVKIGVWGRASASCNAQFDRLGSGPLLEFEIHLCTGRSQELAQAKIK